MEFWGVEVPSGKPVFCDPGNESYVHVSQAALGESKSGKGNDKVVLKVKVGSTEVVVGTLSQGRCDQTPLDLIFDKEFILSHNSTAGSVYFCGYKTDAVKDDEDLDEDELSESEEDTPIPIQMSAKENGKPGAKAVKSEAQAVKTATKTTVPIAEAPVVNAKPQAAKAKPQLMEDDDDDEDDDDEDDEDEDDEEEDDDDEDDEMLGDSSEDDLGSEEEDDSDEADSEDEKPKSAGKKRPLDGVIDAGSEKKQKRITPIGAGKQGLKTEAKTPSTPALTPKQQQQSAKKDASSKKTPGKENGSKGATPSSGKKLGQFLCTPCAKSFQTETALTQHNSAKHK